MKKINRKDEAAFEILSFDSCEYENDDERNKITTSLYKDINDRLWIDCRAARLGVMSYQQSDGSYTNEVHLPEDLFDIQTKYSAFGVPVTIEHPQEGVVTAGIHKIVSVGTVMFPARIDEDYFLRMRMQIFDKDISQRIEDNIQSGIGWDVSCGYSADLDEKPGEFNGASYDSIHRNIRYNHISLVEKGRAGTEVGLVNEDSCEKKWGIDK